MMSIKINSIRTTVIMMVLMLMTKVINFLRDIILTSVYGASSISDAFLVSVAIPTVLVSGIMTALFTSYIPIYKEIEAKDKDYIPRYHTNLTTLVFITSTLLVIVYFIFDDYIIRLFAAGFDEITFEITKSMSAIMIFNIYLMGIAYIFQGFLQANNKFLMVSAGSIPLNLVITVGILISNKTTYFVMPISMVVGYVVYLLWFLIPAERNGFRLAKEINLKDEVVLKTMRMIGPIFCGQIVFEINSIVDKSMASMLPSGSVTIMDYSFKVMTITYALIVNPIATVIFPQLSELCLKKDESKLVLKVQNVFAIILLIMIPVSFLVILLAKPMVEFLFYRGAFSMEAVKKTTEALQVYAFSILPISLRLIIEKVFYAKQLSKIPMYNSMVGVGVNILFDIVLLNRFQHYGLAMATSISSIVTIFIFIMRFKRIYPNFRLKSLFLQIIKYTSIAIVASISVYCFNVCLVLHGIVLMIIDSIIFGVIYLLVLTIIHDPFVMSLINLIKKRG